MPPPPPPPPRKSSKSNFAFKQPHEPSSKSSSSSKHKSHKSKRKHRDERDDDYDSSSRKHLKTNHVKSSSSSSTYTYTDSGHYEKSSQHVPVNIMKNINSCYTKPSSQSRSNISENGDAKSSRSHQYYNGSDRNPNNPIIRMTNLSSDELMHERRRDSKKYHYNVPSSKVHVEMSHSKKSSSRKNSGSNNINNRSLSKSSQHWRTQVNWLVLIAAASNTSLIFIPPPIRDS